MMNTLNQNGQDQEINEDHKLHKTSDLNQFKPIPGNRTIKDLHVKHLMSALLKRNELHLNPLVVTSDMEVVDGNHRLVAARNLGLSVYYIIDDNYDPEKLMMFNNVNLKWQFKDYLKFYMEQGNEDYLKFNEFMQEVGFSITVLMEWMDYHPRKAQISFKEGRLKFRLDKNLLEALTNTKRLIDIMKGRKVKPHSIFGKHAFHRACKHFFLSPFVDADIFFNRLDVCPHTIHVDLYDGFIQQLVDIYNYMKKKQKIQVRRQGSQVEIVR